MVDITRRVVLSVAGHHGAAVQDARQPSPDLACATAHGARAHVAAAHGVASRAVTTVGPGRLVREARSHHPRLERVGKRIGRDVPEGAWIASVQHGFGLLADVHRRRHGLRQSIGQSGGEKGSQPTGVTNAGVWVRAHTINQPLCCCALRPCVGGAAVCSCHVSGRVLFPRVGAPWLAQG